VAALSGCAATYKAPVTAYQPLIAPAPSTKAELLAKAKRALVVGVTRSRTPTMQPA
jgi:hypothetical protein